MKVTIKDVAREAGVAASTVSRVLSDNSRISANTKEKVWEAIRKLDYTPNQMARSLATQKTNILAVVLPQDFGGTFSNPFFMQALKGMSSCAKDKGYFIMYAFKEDDDTWIKRFVQSNFVEGIILFHDENDDDVIDYLKEIEFTFLSLRLPSNIQECLKVENEEEKEIHEANGKYLGNYAIKTIVDIFKNKYDTNNHFINIKFIEKESAFDKMRSMVLYNRKSY